LQCQTELLREVCAPILTSDHSGNDVEVFRRPFEKPGKKAHRPFATNDDDDVIC
jgi:hypothetical protein